MNIRQAAYERMARFTKTETVPRSDRQIWEVFKSDCYTSDDDVLLMLKTAREQRANLRRATAIKSARIIGNAVVAGAHLVDKVVPGSGDYATRTLLSAMEITANAGEKTLGFIERVTLPIIEWNGPEIASVHELPNRTISGQEEV